MQVVFLNRLGDSIDGVTLEDVILVGFNGDPGNTISRHVLLCHHFLPIDHSCVDAYRRSSINVECGLEWSAT